MNLAALRTFLAIEQTGSLVRASELLHVSQSTVTARLQSLENDLGQILFHRQKSGVSLTASGFKFKRYAQAMTDLWRQAREETSLPEGVDAVFNLGCHFDLWPTTGRELVNWIHRESSNTALSATPGKPDEMEQWLETQLVDAALTFQPGSRENQTTWPLYEEQLIVVSHRPDNPIRFDPHYIYVDAGSEFGRRHSAAYTDAGVAKISFGSVNWALEFLLEHGGSAYLPETLVQGHCDCARLYHLTEAPVFTRQVYLVVNDAASKNWMWLSDLLAWLKNR